jgi:hypothetical protein
MKKLLVTLGLMMALTSSGCTLYFGESDDDGGDVIVTNYCEGSGNSTQCYTCYTYPDGWQECFPDSWGCANDDGCAGGCYCDENTGECVEAGYCSTDAECGFGMECDCSGSCIPAGTENRSCNPNSCWQTGCPVGFVCAADGTCVPDGTPNCTSDAECAAGCYCLNGNCEETSICTADNQCPAGQTCDENRTTCEPITGTCYTPAVCNVAPPACNAGELAEVANGCYTGLCLPEASCPDDPPAPACDEITDWNACLAAAPECTAVVGGTNCHRPYGSACQPMDSDCTCDTYTFLGCVDAAP